MKQPFLLIVCLFSFVNLFPQNPAGVSGSVLWLKANTNATNAAWNDNSSEVNNFTQVNAPEQPTLTNNLFNFNPAFEFNGTNSNFSNPGPTNFPTGASSRTVFIVANSTALNGYHWLFTYGNPGTLDATCQLGSGNVGAELTSAFFGSSADMSTPTSFWDNAANTNGALVCFTMDFSSLTETLKNKGVDLVFKTPYRNDLSAPSANAFVGRLGLFGEYWQGNIAEIIMFNSNLSTTDRNLVESYLALKYGFTLGNTASPINYTASDGTTVFWTATATYQNDVFGIGTDNGSALTQTQSNSSNSGNGNGNGQSGKGNLTLSSTLNNSQFLMTGNDALALTEQIIITGQAPPSAVGANRVLRNWKVQNTGAVGNTDVSFDMSGLSFAGRPLSEYKMMIDNDGDGNYTTGTQTFVTPTSITGNILNFTGITFPATAVFTIITQTTGSTLPAIWKDFNVQLKNNSALLSWKTTNEYDVSLYFAEHSADGNNFQAIGSTSALNGSGINSYSLLHENLSSGKHYYRIKLVDKDGKNQYSVVKTISIGGKIGVRLRINPVPINQLDLIINVSQNTRVNLSIVTPDGKIIMQSVQTVSAGTNTLSTDISSLPAGTYLIRTVLDKKVYTNKFIRL